MKSATEYLTFNVPKRMDFVNITSDVTGIVKRSGIQEGLCLVNTTATALLTGPRRPRCRAR